MIKLHKIHSDNRGAILNLVGSDLEPYPEVTVFKTKKGFARGGCVHSMSSEHICVLVGEIEFIYGVEENSLILGAGESFTISPKVPHYFIARTNSVVLEWGPQMDEKNQRHLEFRAKVDAINAEALKIQ